MDSIRIHNGFGAAFRGTSEVLWAGHQMHSNIVFAHGL